MKFGKELWIGFIKTTQEESAKIFKNVLSGEGTVNQNNVVLCNAAMAIKTIHQEKTFADCFYEAEMSLTEGKALKSFKKLIELSN